LSLMQKMEQIRHEYIQLLSIRVSSCLDVGTKSTKFFFLKLDTPLHACSTHYNLEKSM
jgi:hypothetical protein